MLTNETRAAVLEALEMLRYNAGYHELVGGGLEFVPDVAKRALIDAAIAWIKQISGDPQE